MHQAPISVRYVTYMIDCICFNVEISEHMREFAAFSELNSSTQQNLGLITIHQFESQLRLVFFGRLRCLSQFLIMRLSNLFEFVV